MSRILKGLVRNLHLCTFRSCTTDVVPRSIFFQQTIFNTGYLGTRNWVNVRGLHDENPPLEEDTNLNDIGIVLFKENSDSCLVKIASIVNDESSLDSIDYLCSVLDEYKSTLTAKHACQTIVTLYSLKKLNRHCHQFTNRVETDSKLLQHLDQLTNLIENESRNLPDEILICTLHYLRFLKVPQVYLVEKLLDECVKKVPVYSTNSLAYLSACLNTGELRKTILQSNLLYFVLEKLRSCQSFDDLKLIALILKNIYRVANETIFVEFASKVNELVRCSDETISPEVVLSCLRTVFTFCSYYNSKETVKTLISAVEEMLSELSVYKLVTLKTTLRYSDIDTNHIDQLISNRARELFYTVTHPLDKLEILFCIEPAQLKNMQRETMEVVRSSFPMLNYSYHGSKLFTVLRDIKCRDHLFLDTLWPNVFQHFSDDSVGLFERTSVNSYVRFVIGVGGSYRHKSFESNLRIYFLQLLGKDWGFSAQEVACVGAFFIVSSENILPSIIVERIIAHSHHFVSGDMKMISECLRFALQRQRNSEHRTQLLFISDMLDQKTEKYLSSISSLSSLCQYTSAALHRKRRKDSYILDEFMDKYHLFFKDFTSQTLLATSKNITESYYYAPKLIDAMVNFAMRNEITSWSLATLMFACYRVGYYPHAGEEFVDHCTNVLEQDMRQVTAMKILQSALALSLFNQLPVSIVNYIFSVTFLDQADEDIKKSWSSAYADKLQTQLMEINRIVCLEYPEYNVPWFHENYCRENIMSSVRKAGEFEREVDEILHLVFGDGKYYGKHVYTSYGYFLAFECILDSQNHPTDYTASSKKLEDEPLHCDLQRIALNVLKEHDFCVNVRNLIGGQHLKRRHLEIMNYKVVEIPYYEWYSLHLSGDQKARVKLLRKKIFESDP